ncbi:hypothetical protein CYMTET_39235 [Cymbomonas tetramitiformis]|uniref:Stress-response A/B barrel domain-containing protein n=1 Tax=Cymbomonas tetramitiformis TaxID=36881 RepID=A0AAE0F5S6_9CHLO|nr:hypothetical protein CYMTET_39235 [Cymbomonas tetramitiformis]
MPDIVIDWYWSRNLTLDSRSDVNQGFSHLVVVKLKDTKHLEQYLPHPEHIKLKELQGPLIEKIMVLDWIEGENSMENTSM